MILKRVSFFAIFLSLGLGFTWAVAAKLRKEVARPQTTQRASKLAGWPNQSPMRLPDRIPDKPYSEAAA